MFTENFMAYGFAGILALLVIAITILYLKYYKLAINKRLHDETARKRRRPSPWFVSVTSVLVAFAAWLGILGIYGWTSTRGDEESSGHITKSYKHTVFTLSDPGDDYDPTYFLDRHPEYAKTVEQQGDVQFTHYTTDKLPHVYDIYAQYTGDAEIEYYGVLASLYTLDGTLLASEGYIYEGAKDSKSIFTGWVTSVEGRVELTVYFFEPGSDYSKFPDYFNASVSETITIMMPGRGN